MYLIEVTHGWICDKCGVESGRFEKEPIMRKALLGVGWSELQWDRDLDVMGAIPRSHLCPMCNERAIP